MATRPLLYLCAYVLVLSTAAWVTQSQQMVWSVGLLSALALVGRAGTCRDCGQWVAVAKKQVAHTLAPMPRIADQAVAIRPVEQVAKVQTERPVRTLPRRYNPEKRPVPELRFAGRIDHV